MLHQVAFLPVGSALGRGFVLYQSGDLFQAPNVIADSHILMCKACRAYVFEQFGNSIDGAGTARMLLRFTSRPMICARFWRLNLFMAIPQAFPAV